MCHDLLVGQFEQGGSSASSSNLIRWSGLAACLGAVLVVIGDAMHLGMDFENMVEEARGGFFAVHAVVLLAGALLSLLGLIGLYAHQSEATGVFGLVGFLAAFTGTGLVVGAMWGEVFTVPSLAVAAPEFLNELPGPPPGLVPSFIVFAIGWVLFGMAMLRARVYPRWAALLLVVGAVVNLLPVPATSVVWGVGMVCLGFILFSGSGEAVSRQPARVS